jgi:hypothetical protein
MEERKEKLRKDRLHWAIMAFGLLMYTGLGTVLVVYAVTSR